MATNKSATRKTVEPPLWHRVFYRSTWLACVTAGLSAFRTRVRGRSSFPDGGFFLLSNHTSLLDPFWVGTPVVRPVRFMASAQLFRVPVLKDAITILGAFPKKKYVPDSGAIRSTIKYVRAGFPVLIFPEGNRSWDGRTQKILPGIGKLVRSTKVPVVYARVTTGHYVHPRWATYPRFVPLHIEYDGPYTFDKSATVEEIEAHIQRGITIDASQPPPRGSYGWRLAHGLPAFLWACPNCLALDGIQIHRESHDAVECEHCGAAWNLNVRHQLLPRTDSRASVSATTVAAAHDLIVSHYKGWSDDIVDAGELVHMTEDGDKTVQMRGALTLRGDNLEVRAQGESQPLWSAPLASVQAVSIEMRNKLQIRVNDQLYEIAPDRGSTIKWKFFMADRRPATP